ncbi:MAG: DUF2437 domain-containing protein, partial [Nitrospirota bacterium]|nr:DUF2437 domain-containing protein [Nitrospirota bacterium]
MRIVRFSYRGHDEWGVIENDRVRLVDGDPFGGDFIRSFSSAPLDDVRLLAPCLPTKIVCVGLNYKDHAAELTMELPAEPLIFLKPSSAV